MRKFSRSWLMAGRNGMDSPKEMQHPSSQVTASPAAARARRHSSTRRDLPMPASPVMNTTWPRPALTSPKRSSRVASSRSRPMRGVRPRSMATSRRARRPRGRSTSKTWAGARPFTSISPRSRVSKKPATSRCVASLMTTLPGCAFCCRRAARLVVSPTAL